MTDRTMAYQRAWRRTRRIQRELADARRMDEQANPDNEVVGFSGGYMVVKQTDGSFTLQRGLRVLGVGKNWTREQAEAEANSRAV